MQFRFTCSNERQAFHVVDSDEPTQTGASVPLIPSIPSIPSFRGKKAWSTASLCGEFLPDIIYLRLGHKLSQQMLTLLHAITLCLGCGYLHYLLLTSSIYG